MRRFRIHRIRRGCVPLPALALASALASGLAVATAGCTQEPAMLVVIGRVGVDEQAAQAHPPQQAVITRFGERARQAVPASAEGFEVELPPQARRLRLSTAPASGAASDPFVVELRLRDGAAWQPLAAFEPGSERAWRDHARDLPALGPGARLRLRGGADGADDPPLWGSIRLLGPAADPPPANVVLISLDTLGAAHVGALSQQPDDLTPRLDAFLAQGVSLRRAFAHYGNTLVSHASLFSGLVPRRHGVYTDRIPGPLESSLVRRLAAAGYHTAAITEGAFISAAFGFGVGFDAYDETALGIERQMAGGAEETLARAAAFVEHHAPDERFALFVHTYEVHAPYLPRDEESRAFADRRTPGDTRALPTLLQTTGMQRHNTGERPLSPRDLARLRALHEGEVHALDALLGRFLDRLDAASPPARTLVVVTADHGDQFGEAGKVGHGESLHNRVLHVPLGIRWTGVVAPRPLDTPVGLVDVLPTILDLLGLPAPDDRDGVSLAPALRDPQRTLPERPVFSEQRTARGECLQLGLAEDCRLDRLAVQGPRFKLVVSARPPGMALFDLASDPLETRDVAERHPEALAELLSRAEAYRQGPAARAEESGDPLDAATAERLRALGYLDAPGAEPPPAR